MSIKIRVAAAQFHVGNDVDKNLETCLDQVDCHGQSHIPQSDKGYACHHHSPSMASSRPAPRGAK